jgi:hypothetical protein
MAGKLNCWEFNRCGREAGGINADKVGACPASTETRVGGINGGVNGGRACWAIEGTLCGGKVQGSFTMKFPDCRKCDFYKKVKKEERPYWKNAKVILKRMEMP